MLKKSDWPKQTWRFPRIHNFNFGFGLSMEDETKNSTIVPYVFQDNAIVDYETIKTNPENADFAVVDYPNCAAGSYIPSVTAFWHAYIPPTDTEISLLKFNSMRIVTAFKDRLDASDKKTGDTIAQILGLTSEATDEQCYPNWANVKLFEGQGEYDYPAEVPGLTGTQQPESVAFDKEKFFDAMHYYSNKEMLKQVTEPMKEYTVSEPIVPHGRPFIKQKRTYRDPTVRSMNPYTFCGELFHLPQNGDLSQYHFASETTAIEHLCVKGTIRFFEYNPDFNFARA